MRPFARRHRRVLVIAIVLSVAIHFAVGPLFARWHRAVEAGDIIAVSTSLRLEHRSVPEPHVRTKPQAALVKPVPQKQPPRSAVVVPHIAPPVKRHELAKNDPRSTTAAPPPASARTIDRITLEREQAQYAKVIAQAKADNNPLAVPSSTPAAYKRYTMSFEGKDNPLRSGEGILYPVKSWKADGFNYYYVDYSMVFADGARDQGHVPWPLRYKPSEDPFALHYRGHFPLPPPLPDYVLPPEELPLNPTLRPYFPNLYPNGE